MSYEQAASPELPLIPPADRPEEPLPQRLLPVDAATVDRAHAELEAAGRIRQRRRRPVELFFDLARREVRVVDSTIRLTYAEFEVFRLLANRPYWPFASHEIVEGVARFDCGVTSESLDGHVASLREKLGDYSDYIQTVPGFGYRFKE